MSTAAMMPQAIPSSKYVVGKGPAYNMSHSFDEKTRTFVISNDSIVNSSAAPDTAV